MSVATFLQSAEIPVIHEVDVVVVVGTAGAVAAAEAAARAGASVFLAARRSYLGDDVAEELHATLARWLVNHIKRDDADYVESVRASMAPGARALAEENKKTGWFRRLFGR